MNSAPCPGLVCDTRDHSCHASIRCQINFRWRTALILRELEDEVVALARGRTHRARLMELVTKKVGRLYMQLDVAQVGCQRV